MNAVCLLNPLTLLIDLQNKEELRAKSIANVFVMWVHGNTAQTHSYI